MSAAAPRVSIRAVAAAETRRASLPLAELLGVPDTFRPGERRAQGMAPLRLGGSIALGAAHQPLRISSSTAKPTAPG